MGKFGLKKIALLAGLVLAMLLAVPFFLTTIQELRMASFQARGRVFDETTREPVGEMVVLLLLSQGRVADRAGLDRRLEEARIMAEWDRESGADIENPGWAGFTGPDGTYVARAKQMYEVRYFSLLGLGRPKGHPFTRAWLVFDKPGFQRRILEVDLAGWEQAGWNWEKGLNQAPDAYLQPAVTPVNQ
ncbi:MAG: hypothetical protein AB1896_05655 [Thermodesulfobacteriota bacterium]